MTFQSEDSWSDISSTNSLPRRKTRSVPRIEPLRNLSETSIGRDDVEFWDGVRISNEKEERKEREREKEREKEDVMISPRGGSLVRSARRNFAMALAAEYSNKPTSDAPPLPMSDVRAVQQHELTKKDEEIAELKRMLESQSLSTDGESEIAKRDKEIDELKQKLTDEYMRTKIFKEKFHDMQRLYHESELGREKQKTEDGEATTAEVKRLSEELAEMKKKFDNEREKRRFYRDKFHDMQKLYQDSLESVVEFQERIKSIGKDFGGKLGSDKSGADYNKLEQQLAEEKVRKQFFKDKFQEMQRLYQEALESMTSFVEKSTNVEKLYRSTLEDAKNSLQKTQELEGLYIETQESVEFFREKTKVVEEACREAMKEAEYFRLKAEKYERSLIEAQKSLSLYEENLDAMSGMLRESQNEAMYYKQKSHETHVLLKEALKEREREAHYDDDVAEVVHYKVLAEEAERRVLELEAKVSKMKAKKANSPIRSPKKLVRSPSGSPYTEGYTSHDKETLKSSDSSDSQANKEEEQEGVDFPWLDFVRSNYRMPSELLPPIDEDSSLRSKSGASPDSTKLPTTNYNYDLQDDESESKRDSKRNTNSKQRAHKLQQQIQHRLQQKALSEKSLQRYGDVG